MEMCISSVSEDLLDLRGSRGNKASIYIEA